MGNTPRIPSNLSLIKQNYEEKFRNTSILLEGWI